MKFGPIYRVFCGSIPEMCATVCLASHIISPHADKYLNSVLTDPEDVRAFYHDAKDHSKANNIGFGEYIGR